MADAPTKPLSEIVATVQVFARQYQAVLDLAAAVDEVAKLEQLRAEADARLRDKLAEVDAAQTNLQAIMAQISAANLAASKAASDVKALEGAAKNAGKEIIEKASAQASQIIDEAKARAASIDGKSEDAQKALTEVEGQLAEKAAAIKAMSDEHELIVSKIDAAKDRIAKMMGA